MDIDWRLLRGQYKYLHRVILFSRSYQSNNALNDHDHCEFCMVKFGKGSSDLKQGYCTEDRKIWICPRCYDDFKNLFEWEER